MRIPESDNASMGAVFEELQVTENPTQETAVTPEPEETAPPTEAVSDDIPAFLKETEEVDDDEEDPDAFLESLTDAPKDNLEEWRANKEKGLRKIVERAKAKESALQQREAELAKLETYVDAFAGENWQDAYDKLGRQLQLMHNAQLSPQPTQVNGQSEEDLVANESWEQTKARWKAELKAEMRAELQPEIAPLKEFRSQVEAQKALDASVAKATAELQARYGEVVTPERVRQAAIRFPSIEPADAFRAAHADDIARWTAKFAESRQTKPKREMIGSDAIASREAPERAPGAYFSMQDAYEALTLQAE